MVSETEKTIRNKVKQNSRDQITADETGISAVQIFDVTFDG